MPVIQDMNYIPNVLSDNTVPNIFQNNTKGGCNCINLQSLARNICSPSYLLYILSNVCFDNLIFHQDLAGT